MYREILHETALKAPSSSGVYMWRDPQDTVIYVGKAKSLKNRLSSYFSGKKDIKTRLLISHAKRIEYITTANEYEAFLLENNLIKKYNPKYNINLKDGKSYPSLRITNEDFPRLFKTRHILHDGSTYFGPYPDATALDTFIETLYQIYPLRHCKKFVKKDSPCLYYHMGQCKAPCCGKISKESYNEFFGEISDLLNENNDETSKKLTAKMKEAAAALNFEKAARLRDGLRALMIMQNQNIVESFDSEDRDYIAHYREGELVSFTVLKIRAGKLLGRDNHRVTSLNEDDELVTEFMNAYYTEKEEVPPKIFVPEEYGLEMVSRRFKEDLGIETQVIAVKMKDEDAEQKNASISPALSSRDIAAMNMARHNAKEDIVRRLRERGDMPALQELKDILGLKHLPERIEGFDIAHIGGKFPVASLISFYKGNPDKKNYRYFRLKTTDGYIDDFQSMREATSRRYTRLLNEEADLPDLILIDGGIGQVNAVDQVLKSLDLDIPIAGLAKRDEEIWRPYADKPISLPKRSDALRLLQRVRDETHRFATSRNQRLRTKENVVSIFLDIPGIGEKRARLLTKTYTTLENMCMAEESAIAELLHVRADEATEILMIAKSLLEKRNERKEVQKQSLQAAGTTWQKAAQAQYIEDLAGAALAAEKPVDYNKE
ncbi:MAG: excinuclease ABC subunit UvrC [Treponema sp.]|nr:excinuclease ABC subunit UvrC [Treponema sp.]